MSEWDRSMFSMSGADFEIQEAVQAMERLIRGDSVRATTRVVLQGALKALENELELLALEDDVFELGPELEIRA